MLKWPVLICKFWDKSGTPVLAEQRSEGFSSQNSNPEHSFLPP